jgi:hypothetical protein
MALLNKEQIKNAPDIETTDVAVPEWGGNVRVRGLTAKQRAAIVKRVTTFNNGNASVNVSQMQLLVVLVGCVDESGNRLFSETDSDWLNDKGARPLFRVFQAIAKLSGMDGEAEEAAAKNSESTLSDDSLSDWP